MITVTLTNIEYGEELSFVDSKNGLIGMTVSGHAIPGLKDGDNPPEMPRGLGKGRNILCAAVSFGALNLLRSMAVIAGIRPVFVTKDGYMSMSVSIIGLEKGQIDTMKVLIESFLIGMLDLQKENPGFIEIHNILETT